MVDGVSFSDSAEENTKVYIRERSGISSHFLGEHSRAPFSVSLRLWLSGILASADVVAIAALVVILAGPRRIGPAEQLLLAVGAVAAGVAAHALGFYTAESMDGLKRTVSAVLGSAILAIPVITSTAWYYRGVEAALEIFASATLATMAIVGVRLLCLHTTKRHAPRISEHVLLVSTPRTADRILASTTSAADDLFCVGYVAIGSETVPVAPVARLDLALEQPSGLHADMLPGCLYGSVDRVVIAGEDLDETTLNATLQRIEHLPFEISLAPFCRLLGEAGSALARSNCITLRGPAMEPRGIAVKRSFDVLVASLLMLLLLPLLLLVAALIRLESPGPVLFRQTRWGWNNQPFTVYKFRTMWADATATDGSVQASRGDTRITRLGRLLRKLSVDELPQLLNVLNGTMSLVGPRPHPAELNRRFLPLIERYPARHRVRPGITGWAQVNGLRGETRTVSAMQRRIDLDLEYIRNWSFTFDLWIMLRTLASVLKTRDVY